MIQKKTLTKEQKDFVVANLGKKSHLVMARELGVSNSWLFYQIKEHGLNPTTKKPEYKEELDFLYNVINATFKVDIRTRRRFKKVSIPKQLFCYLATRNSVDKKTKTIHTYGLANIGEYCMHDYTCVIHSKKVIEGLLSVGDEYTLKVLDMVKAKYMEYLKRNTLLNELNCR